MTDVLETNDVQVELARVRQELSETMNQLASVRAYRDELVASLNTVRSRFRSDVELIGETFLRSFRDDGETSAYRDLADEINPRLLYDLPDGRSEFVVQANIRVKMTVEAVDSDEAKELAESAISDIEGSIDEGSWGEYGLSVTSYPDSSYSYDVEEQ